MADGVSETLSRPLALLARRRRIFGWTAVAALGVAGAFVYGLPNVYRASATLLVQEQLPDTVLPLGVGSGIDGRLQIIKQEALSRARLTALLEQFDLYGVAERRTSVDRALERLQRDIRVDATSTDQNARGGTQTLAFRVSYVGSRPQVAADVANAVASFFVAHNDQLRAGEAARAATFLGDQLAATRQRLEEQEGRVRAFSAHNLGALPQQTDANIAAINRLDSQLRLNDTEQMKLVERRQELKGELAALQVQRPPQSDTSPEAEQARLEQALSDLRAKFGDAYPDVKAAQARLDDFKRERARTPAPASAASPELSQRAVLDQALSEVEGQIQHLSQEDAALRGQIAGYQSRVEQAPAQAPAFDGLMRDYQATRDQYDGLEKRYLEAQLAQRAESGADTQEFRVLDTALPPASPAGPSRLWLFGAGAVLALLGAWGAAFVADRADSSFHSVDDLRAFTRVPVLASIPDIREPTRWSRRLWHAAVAGAGLVAVGALAVGAFQVAHSSEQVARLLSRVM